MGKQIAKTKKNKKYYENQLEKTYNPGNIF